MTTPFVFKLHTSTTPAVGRTRFGPFSTSAHCSGKCITLTCPSAASSMFSGFKSW